MYYYIIIHLKSVPRHHFSSYFQDHPTRRGGVGRLPFFCNDRARCYVVQLLSQKLASKQCGILWVFLGVSLVFTSENLNKNLAVTLGYVDRCNGERFRIFLHVLQHLGGWAN